MKITHIVGYSGIFLTCYCISLLGAVFSMYKTVFFLFGILSLVQTGLLKHKNTGVFWCLTQK